MRPLAPGSARAGCSASGGGETGGHARDPADDFSSAGGHALSPSGRDRGGDRLLAGGGAFGHRCKRSARRGGRTRSAGERRAIRSGAWAALPSSARRAVRLEPCVALESPVSLRRPADAAQHCARARQPLWPRGRRRGHRNSDPVRRLFSVAERLARGERRDGRNRPCLLEPEIGGDRVPEASVRSERRGVGVFDDIQACPGASPAR